MEGPITFIVEVIIQFLKFEVTDMYVCETPPPTHTCNTHSLKWGGRAAGVSEQRLYVFCFSPTFAFMPTLVSFIY